MKSNALSALALAATLILASHSAAARDGAIDSTDMLMKIRPGSTTSAQLTEIAGKPIRVQHFPRQGTETWTYSMQVGGRLQDIAVDIDDKGIVRSVEPIRRWGP